MVLIPPDIGLRLRLQNELLPQPITPVQEIPADLPDLKTGQTFNARIQEVLPENTYRALVAGKSITLSLPESVKTGDMLELVVVDRTPKTIIAQLAAQSGATTDTGAAAYPHATFSRAAQLIGTLLPAEGQSPSAAPLNRGQPLLAQPPQTGSELAPILGKAVTESGLFYESHQAQWVAGKLSLASLLHEPQGMRSSPQAKIAAQADQLTSLANAKQDPHGQPLPVSLGAAQAGIQPFPGQLQLAPGQPPLPPGAGVPVDKLPVPAQLQVPPGQPALPPGSGVTADKLPLAAQSQILQESYPPLFESNTSTGKSEATARAKEIVPPLQSGSQPLTPNQLASSLKETAEIQRQQTNSQVSQPMTAASIPDELRPLVQQQLDAAGTQRLIWHGEVWPGQTMQWEIEWKDQGGGNSGQDDTEPWATTLRLNTPRLGEVEAALRLGAGGVHIALSTPLGASADDLRAGAPLLEQALASAGVPMLGFTVKQSQEPEPEARGTVNG
ncbi:MAG: flagellar hook-length control protein FliK [Proteobacteria bacterium]|nr:flagellar hook-length control protein FliK [Pseudomonadota bacterium]